MNPDTRVLRFAPPVAALAVAFALQVIVVTDTVGTALAATRTGTNSSVWYLLAAILGIAVATSVEAGAAYLMALYDRHLRARDSVWQLRLGMVTYVGLSATVIHWWLGTRGLPQIVAWVLAGMSASALWLWSRGSRWDQRREMIVAGQIDPALPRLPTVSKMLHPIRWLVTLWLISWEPVSTTAQARARYDEWRSTRRFLPRPSARSIAVYAELPSVEPSMIGRSTPSKSTAKGARGRKPIRSDHELAALIRERSWGHESLNFLASQLRVSKRRAAQLRRLATGDSVGGAR